MTVPRLMRSWLAGFVGIAVTVPALGQPAAEEIPPVDATVTALDYGAKVLFNDKAPLGAAPTQAFFYIPPRPGETPSRRNSQPLKVQVSSPNHHDSLILFIPAAECTLVMHSVEVELRLLVDASGRQSFEFLVRADAVGDWFDIYRAQGKDPRPVNVEFADVNNKALAIGASIRGAGRFARTASGIEVTVVDGTFEYARGGADARLETLGATGENCLVVASSGAGARRSDAGMASKMIADRSGIIQRSLLRSFAKVAEETAEGDLQPPTRGSPVAAGTSLVIARVTDIVPRGVGFSSLALAASSGTAASVSAQSTAESFLTANNAALAVVGARLQNTRVVANPGGALSISGEATPRFTLGRPR